MTSRDRPINRVQISNITPKNILTRSRQGSGNLNPFVGCSVACAYCYVPRLSYSQYETRKWGTYVDIKEGSAEKLEKALTRSRIALDVFMSSATDPYQAIEEQVGVTRAILKVFERHPRHSLILLTKQKLVTRDIDILSRLRRIAVGISISVLDDRLASVIEPWASTVTERFEAIRELTAADIATFIFWAPAITPFRIDKEYCKNALDRIVASQTRSLSIAPMNYCSAMPDGLIRVLARSGHRPSSAEQIELLKQESESRGLRRRIEIEEETEIEDAQPFFQFEE